MRDATGQMYERNRYYDPGTGQFTQPDPIGIAGGLNVYGFANGDPVSYDDPYGLCILPKIVCETAAAAARNLSEFADRTRDEYLEKGFDAFFREGFRGGSPARDLITVSGAGLVGRLTSGASLGRANFAQRTYSETFSPGGRFAGQTINQVAGRLRSGNLTTADVPIYNIVRDGNTLILNTRSAQALQRAGIPRSQWNAVNVTGDAAAEARLTGQLQRNNLTSSGIAEARSSGR